MVDLIAGELEQLPEGWRELAETLIREWTANQLAALAACRMCRCLYEAGELLRNLGAAERPERVLAEVNRMQRAAARTARQLDLPPDVPLRGEESFRERWKGDGHHGT
jgi:hypothetical protein